MRSSTKVLVAALMATIALAAATSAANARRIEVNSILFLVEFPAFRFEDGAGGFNVNCPVELEGQFRSRTISKVSGALIGSILHAIVRTCTTGNAWTLTTEESRTNTLPWPIWYISFSGMLPTITRVRIAIARAGFTFERGGGVLCLYRPNEVKPIYGDLELNAEGRVTGVRLLETEWIPAETPFCPIHGFVRGTGEIGVDNAFWEPIRMRLVA